MSSTVSFAETSSMSLTSTWAPSTANRTAVARPMPEPAPVTMATLPPSRVIASSIRFAAMTTPTFADRYGPWAFIAGASMGIGAALSHEAAARGLNVVLNARGKEQLERTATEVADKHGVETRTLAADLADPEIGTVVAAAVDDLDIGLFVYNAAVAPAGRFLDVDLDKHLL